MNTWITLAIVIAVVFVALFLFMRQSASAQDGGTTKTLRTGSTTRGHTDDILSGSVASSGPGGHATEVLFGSAST